jgi:hypothetical protein
MDKRKTSLKRNSRNLDENDSSPPKVRRTKTPHMSQVTANFSSKAKHGKRYNSKDTKHSLHNLNITKDTPTTSKQSDRQTPSTSQQPDRQTPSTSQQPDRQKPSTSQQPDRNTPSTKKDKPYKVIEYRTRYIKKYAAEELIYQVKFAREWQHQTLGDLQDSFY